MCGIGLIVSGVPIEGHFSPDDDGASGFSCDRLLKTAVETIHPSCEDLCNVLASRGPDHIGGQSLYLSPSSQCLEKLEVRKNFREASDTCGNEENSVSPEITDAEKEIAEFVRCGVNAADENPSCRFQFVGSTLQLRGDHPVQQPVVDSVGNVLVYNGEIFGGLDVRPAENDTEVIMEALHDCCSCACHGQRVPVPECDCAEEPPIQSHQTVPQLLSQLRGPWALIYWQAVSRTLWFGRDAIGRRSVLIHKPTQEDPRLLLTSVAPGSTKRGSTAIASRASRGNVSHGVADIRDYVESPGQHIDHQRLCEERADPAATSVFWEEMTCGIHSISYQAGIDRNQKSEGFKAWARVHGWHDPLLNKLLAWRRDFVNPNEREEDHALCRSDTKTPAEQVLAALCQAVRRRTENIRRPMDSSQQQLESRASSTESIGRSRHYAPIAVLFSGGVDSMILAAIADQFVDRDACIDLLNVSFEGDLAPDRITAVSGLSELKEVFPLRRWRLLKIDALLSDMQTYRRQLLSLICPSNTYMDLNIGTALWLAASGRGYVHEISSEQSPVQDSVAPKVMQSEARVLMVGSGADEQCGGYGRHRTKFRQGGWEALDAEMRLDFQRIWKRNLGRDDRCLSDHGKEARFPFLDEDVVATLLGLPLWDVVNMEEPAGCGEKKILREVARLLGLKSASSLPKRAIQFGSRIARESNRKDFGSNRAANLANAGTVILREVANENVELRVDKSLSVS